MAAMVYLFCVCLFRWQETSADA